MRRNPCPDPSDYGHGLMLPMLAIALMAGACSGDDFEAATTDVVYAPKASDAGGTSTPDQPRDAVGSDKERDAERPEDVRPQPDDGPPPQEDAGPVDEPDTGWSPEWTEHDDPTVQSCLESFPILCDKVNECGQSDPITGLLGGYCPELIDGNVGTVIGYCEGVAQGVADAAGSTVATTISDFLQGCIENYDCDPASLAVFGDALGQLATLFGEGGSGDFASALPILLELAGQCGGLGGLLPF